MKAEMPYMNPQKKLIEKMTPTNKKKKKGFFFHPFFLHVAKAVPSGMRFWIMSGPLKNKKWIIGSAAGEGKGLSIIINKYETRQIAHAHEILGTGRYKTCFDIGANVGLYTLLFSQHSERVYSFEPLPRNLKFLIQLLEANNIANVDVIPSAVSSSPGIGFFSEGANNALGKLDKGGRIPVMITTCDQFVFETGIVPDLLKIDVEGDELNVLKGSRKLLENHHPSILLSIHGDQLRTDCLDFLRGMNYNEFVPVGGSTLQRSSEFAIHYHA